MIRAIRWACFFTVGFATNALVVLVVLAYLPYWWFKVRGKIGKPFAKPKAVVAPSEILRLAKDDDLRDGVFVDHDDTHNLLCHQGRVHFNTLAGRHVSNSVMLHESLDPKGSLFRYSPHGYREWPSGDMAMGWCRAYVLSDRQDPHLVDELASHFIKNCFTLAWYNGELATRAACGGLSVDNEGWPRGKTIFGWKWPFKWGLSQPITGPAYFTGAAILALAAKETGKWRYWLIYGLHWFVCFGWFWSLVPYVYTKKRQWYYSAHITQTALFVLGRCGIKKKHAMRWIAETAAPTKGVVNPFIAGMANEFGALSDEGRDFAISILLSGYKDWWPQQMFAHRSELKIDRFEGKKLYSQMGLALHELGVK